MSGDDHGRGPVSLEAADGPEPGFESCVVRFNPVVGVLGGVVTRRGQDLVDGSSETPMPDRS